MTAKTILILPATKPRMTRYSMAPMERRASDLEAGVRAGDSANKGGVRLYGGRQKVGLLGEDDYDLKHSIPRLRAVDMMVHSIRSILYN